MANRQDKATADRNAKTLRDLVKHPDNKLCADCKRNDARWASWNIGCFVCIRCSGIHRSMGTHISKVKSVDLDMWTPEQMASVQKWGNRRANLYWEAHLKPGHLPPDHKMESFIRSKYESRRWALDGPPPSDPSILEGSNAEASASSVAQPTENTQSAAPAAPVVSTPSVLPQPPANPSHSLLSSTHVRTASSSNAPPVQPPSVQNDLFSLDFTAPAPPTNTNPTATQKNVKEDILSLFSANTTQLQPQPVSLFDNLGGQHIQQQPNAMNTMIGSGGPALWGADSWSTPQMPLGGNVWQTSGTPFNNAAVPLQNVWGNAHATAPSTNSGTTPAQPKQDDAFSDLWGGFK